jgi:hypothetical protein
MQLACQEKCKDIPFCFLSLLQKSEGGVIYRRGFPILEYSYRAP